MDTLLILKNIPIKHTDKLTSLNEIKCEAKQCTPKKKKKERCGYGPCNKKLKFLDCSLKCSCDMSFCTIHRLPENHECTYDFKSRGKKILENKLPKVSSEKVVKI